MVELVDAPDSKSGGLRPLRVRVPLPALPFRGFSRWYDAGSVINPATCLIRHAAFPHVLGVDGASARTSSVPRNPLN